MSRFYAEIKGNRGQASRMGTEKSGMWAHVRGWHVGVIIECIVNEDGNDEILIRKTGGSSSGSSSLETVMKITKETTEVCGKLVKDF